MDKVTVVSVEAGEYFSGSITSGSTVNVTLERDGDYATCKGILIWEDEGANSDLFDEWVAYAMDGEEGYSATVTEWDGVTTTYGA
jgi:hypothetical protein